MKRKKLYFAVLTVVLAALFITCIVRFVRQRPADIPEGLSYEVKFLLDPDLVLDEDQRLTGEFADLFELEDEYRVIDVIYLDTGDRAFEKEGWTNRIRWKDGKKKAERLCKKRYSISGNDISSAVEKAEKEGFELSDDRYSPEVEWGYFKMTLSLSFEKSGRFGDYTSLAEAGREDAVEFLEEMMPEEEAGWKKAGWGTETLSRATIIGPVRFYRVKGIREDTEVSVDIWPIGGSAGIITELSFKTDDFREADEVRTRFTKLLEKTKVLLHEDFLKTQVILNTY